MYEFNEFGIKLTSKSFELAQFSVELCKGRVVGDSGTWIGSTWCTIKCLLKQTYGLSDPSSLLRHHKILLKNQSKRSCLAILAIFLLSFRWSIAFLLIDVFFCGFFHSFIFLRNVLAISSIAHSCRARLIVWLFGLSATYSLYAVFTIEFLYIPAIVCFMSLLFKWKLWDLGDRITFVSIESRGIMLKWGLVALLEVLWLKSLASGEWTSLIGLNYSFMRKLLFSCLSSSLSYFKIGSSFARLQYKILDFVQVHAS